MPKHPSLRFFAALAAHLGLGLLVAGCRGKDQGQAPPSAFATPVTAVAAISRDVPVFLDEIGKAVGSQSVIIVSAGFGSGCRPAL